MVLFLRFFIALVFLVSGGEKVMNSPANFRYVIDAYQLLPPALSEIVSVVFPWIELLTGVFVLLGLWLRPALCAAAAMSMGFIVFVAQALIRRLPLDNCGCFGDLMHFKPQHVIWLDSFILLSVAACLWRRAEASRCSLDGWYGKKS